MRTDEEMRELLRPQMQGGMLKFTLKLALLWCVLLGIFEALERHFLEGQPFWRVLIPSLIAGMLAGIMFGIWYWYYLRHRYRIRD